MSGNLAGRHGPGPDRAESLVTAIELEARLLDRLVGIVRRQRDGVIGADARQVGESVFAVHRVLHTIGEARRRRRTLAGSLAGSEAIGLDALAAALGARMTPRLRRACGELRRVAEVLAREVALNQRVVRRACALPLQPFQAGSRNVSPGRS